MNRCENEMQHVPNNRTETCSLLTKILSVTLSSFRIQSLVSLLRVAFAVPAVPCSKPLSVHLPVHLASFAVKSMKRYTLFCASSSVVVDGEASYEIINNLTYFTNVV